MSSIVATATTTATNSNISTINNDASVGSHEQQEQQRPCEEIVKIPLHEYSSDSDEEPSYDEDHPLDWRLDPDESYSDWKIVVTSLEDSIDTVYAVADRKELSISSSSSTVTYHVHKSILGLGSHRSDYFARLFQNGSRFAEATSSTSTIDLDFLSAQVFPDFLDYVYQLHSKESLITTQNAVAMYQLASYFGVRRLRWEAKKFWKQDLSLDNCHVYYAHAQLLHDDKIQVDVIDLCAGQNILLIHKDSKLLAVTDPKFWRTVFQHPASKEQNLPNNVHWSVLIAEFCSQNTANLTLADFQDLTSPEFMNRIHPSAAQQLLTLEAKFQAPETISNPIRYLSPLQERCVRGLAGAWADLELDQQETMDFLRQQNPSLLTELFTLSTSRAQVEHMTLDGECRQMHERYEELRSSYTRLCQRSEAESMTYTTVIHRLEHSNREWENLYSTVHLESMEHEGQCAKLQTEVDKWQSIDCNKKVMELEESNSKMHHVLASTMSDLLQSEQEKLRVEDELELANERATELENELAEVRHQRDQCMSKLQSDATEIDQSSPTLVETSTEDTMLSDMDDDDNDDGTTVHIP